MVFILVVFILVVFILVVVVAVVVLVLVVVVVDNLTSSKLLTFIFPIFLSHAAWLFLAS